MQFVYSLELNSAGSLCILHIINPDDETESILQEVKNRLQSTTLIIVREMVDLANKTPDYQRTYYACSRYIILPELMKKYQFDVYLSDIDAFIKKDLVLLRKEYVNHDLAIFWRLNIEYTRRLLGGTVYIKNTPVTYNVFQRASKILAKRPLKWMDDQVVLYEAVMLHRSKLKIANLAGEYADWRTRPDAVIWTGKGDKKYLKNYQDYDDFLMKQFFHTKTDKKHVAILAPRIDIPFKDTVGITANTASKFLQDPVRTYWLYFPKILKKCLETQGYNVELIVQPNWIVQQDYIATLPHQVIYVPHRNHFQIQDERCIFYMQELYPSCFTLDKQGWAASSSKYKAHEYLAEDVQNKTEEFIETIKEKRITKFAQNDDQISKFKYDIFFPLQIPHDQTLQFHSKYSLEEIVGHVIKWAEVNQIKVLFKTHPFDRKVKYLDRTLLNPEYIHITPYGNIHDYIKNAKVVFVANSGVGFESLIYNKPVVTFAQAIYDVVTYRCDINTNNLTDIYNMALLGNNANRWTEYKKFIQWYLFKEIVDIFKPEITLNTQIEAKPCTIPNIFYQDIHKMLQNSTHETFNTELNAQYRKDRIKILLNRIHHFFSK